MLYYYSWFCNKIIYFIVINNFKILLARYPGEPVDWQHLPPKPQFPKHVPIPLPSPTPVSPGMINRFNLGLDPALFTSNRTIDDDDTLDRLYRQLQIVTAFSQNHYKEALGLIGTVQKEMPDKKLVIYDLGIDPDTRFKVYMIVHVSIFSSDKLGAEQDFVYIVYRRVEL